MKVLSYFFFLLLSASALVGAQTLPREPEATANRPLNLSARKPVAPVSDASVILLPPAPAPGAVVPLPYGAGYESRQQGSNAGSGNTGSGSGGGGSSGNGGGGRGGSGRGR